MPQSSTKGIVTIDLTDSKEVFHSTVLKCSPSVKKQSTNRLQKEYRRPREEEGTALGLIRQGRVYYKDE